MNIFHKIRPLLLVAVLLVAILVSITGCDSSKESNPSNTSDTSIESATTSSQSGDIPTPPISMDVSFPDGAPPLGESAELRCTVKTHHISAKNMSIQVNLPEAFQLESGELSWLGNVPADSEVAAIRAFVKSIKTGNWTIDITDYINPEDHGFFGGTGAYHIYVSIAVDSAQWRLNPSYDNPTPGPGQVSISPPDGGDDTSDRPPPPTVTIPPQKSIDNAPSSPIEVKLSISKLPLLNETVDLTCTVSSIYDAPDSAAKIKLPEGAALIGGNLEWQGDLKADVPTSFSVKIVFKDTGHQVIEGSATRVIDIKNSWGDLDCLCLNIGADQSTIGWQPTAIKINQVKPGEEQYVTIRKSPEADEPELEDLGDLPTPPAISLDGVMEEIQDTWDG